MVAQDDNSARIILARAHDRAKPLNLFGPKRTVRLNEVFQKRPADGIVAGVQCYEAPIFVFQAEETGLLAAWRPIRYEPQLRQYPVEIGKAARIHFMVAVQCKTSMRSIRPKARLKTMSWVFDPEKIFVDLVGTAYVIHIAQMNRIVRLEGNNQLAHRFGFVRTRCPIAGERNPNFLAAFHLVHALIWIPASIDLKGMA